MIPYIKFTSISGKFIFLNPLAEKGTLYGFTSDIDKIGYGFDVTLQNGSYVDVISDPVEINHLKYGAMSVTKVRADVAIDYHSIIKELWIPTSTIVKNESVT